MKDVLERSRAAADGIESTQRSGLNAAVAYERSILWEQARTVKKAGRAGVLAGLPLGVKDNICTKEYPTTCASRILEGYRSPFEATAVARLKSAGCVVACKTNLDEFAMGASTEHSMFGRTRHPEDPTRVAGGSSGGSAAIVAAGALEAALGSETGGSVRQPASFCGIVGIKPSYGRVSRYGLVAFGSSLDQIGVLSRSIDTGAAVLSAMSGWDKRDATCSQVRPFRIDDVWADFPQMTIGVPVEYHTDELHSGIRKACGNAINRMRDAGAKIRTVSLPNTKLAVPAYYILALAEASSNLARYDGVRLGLRVAKDNANAREMSRTTRCAGFGPEVCRRIIVGTYVLSAGYWESYYEKAVAARCLITRDFAKVFASGIDLLFTPTTPTTAFVAGAKVNDPIAMYLSDVFVSPANLAWLPAVSMPIGRSKDLPIGGQFIAPRFEEGRMIGAAKVLEQLIDPMDEFG
ncbi:MAG: Asp-tRNA(Asn)/Glu-tRNA(Gln) amidotransferase subunit GatA [Gemmatimonadales bacterium]